MFIAKKTIALVIVLISIVLMTKSAFAHVVVQPATVGVAAFQTFDIGVPSEKDNATVAIKLLIPQGLDEVTPNVKPGWTVGVVKDGDTVTEIDWTDGEIPAGQRDDFYFSAQAPATTTNLIWKAYQTYADDSVVSWDANPATFKNGEEGTPYSTTKVINDLSITPPASQQQVQSSDHKATTALIFSIVAIAIASVALSIARKQTSQKQTPILLRKSSRSRKKIR